jgi:hypothetical protein
MLQWSAERWTRWRAAGSTTIWPAALPATVDERWLVPHFEKMLYDNALLTGAYLDGYLATGDPHHARVVRETATTS